MPRVLGCSSSYQLRLKVAHWKHPAPKAASIRRLGINCPSRKQAVKPRLDIFAHNHPSGLAEPSRADEVLTQALKQALALVDVKVLDHFIVGGSSAMSFAERGLL